MNSNYSSIYKSPTWLYPNKLKYSESPFIDEDFLNYIFSCNSEIFEGYGIYTKILEKFCGDFLKYPVNNFMVKAPWQEELNSYGIEPKSLPVKTKKNDTQIKNKTTLNARQEKLLSFLKRVKSGNYGDYLKSVIHLLN